MKHDRTGHRTLGGQSPARACLHRPSRRIWGGRLAAWVWVLAQATALLLLGAMGQAQAGKRPQTAKATTKQEQVTVALNQSRVIKLGTQAARVSVANPEVADILVIDPRQIYVVGKSIGTTNVTLWDADDKVRGAITLDVTPDLDLLKTRLHEVLPGERVQVRSAQGSIVVSGTVSSPTKAEAAVQLAQSFADAAGAGAGVGQDNKAKVLNLIQVGGSQQVMLEVKVAEIKRDLVKRLDINFTGFYNGGSIKIGTAGPGTSFPGADFKHWIDNPNYGFDDKELPYVIEQGSVPQFADRGMRGPAIPEFAPGKSITQNKALFLQSLSGNFLFNLVIDAAKNNGLAKILAEPNLTTLSGQEAEFLAGGEFPIPVPQDNGNTTIAYKDYGIALQFVPVVLDSGVISMKVNVSVSDLVAQNSASISTGAAGGGTNFFVPALSKRSANATVEIKTGQTIAIAGLINESLRENVNKFPGLGDLPIIGLLFRSQEFIKGQTELVIFVTPRLARSFNPELVKLPTDSFVEPTDREFYLMGRMEGRKPQSQGHSTGGALGPDKSGSEGAFGHDL